ncbi:MAG: chromosome partitioning protein ParB, partial [Pseudomonadota bacterium]|nr:chromosome partitioning protein ParB [Pseudomonadota bacterium]
GDDEAFAAVFATLCGRYDGPEWDLELLRSAIETEIAAEADVSIHAIRVELDAQLPRRGIDMPTAAGDQGDDPVREKAGAAASTTPLKQKGAAGIQAVGDSRGDTVNAIAEHEMSDDETPNNADADRQETPSTPLESPVPSTETPPAPLITLSQPGPTDLKSLRARAWTLAARLAQRNGIGALVAPLSGRGLGFILRDVPDSALVDQLDADTLGQISMLWWQLAACAEMTVAPLPAVIATLSDDSILRQALENQDAGLLFNSVWTLDPGHTGHRLWRQLGEQDWQDLLSLMDTYRHIHRAAQALQIRLWEES